MNRRFNEPDNAGQSNISPADAAALWLEYIEPFASQAKLVSPAITNGGAPSGVTWMQDFLGNCTTCTIDAIAMHWYDTAVVSKISARAVLLALTIFLFNVELVL